MIAVELRKPPQIAEATAAMTAAHEATATEAHEAATVAVSAHEQRLADLQAHLATPEA